MRIISKIRFVIRNLTYFKGVEELERSITCTGLISGKTMIINNLEKFQHGGSDSQSYQVKICESDGIYGCEIGNWISLRRHSGFVFFIPAFTKIEETKHAIHDVFPPKYLMKDGILAFHNETFDQIYQYAPALPRYNEIKELTVDELFQVHNYEIFTAFFRRPYPSKEEYEMEVHYTVIGDNSKIINNEVAALQECTTFKFVKVDNDDQFIEMYLTTDDVKKCRVAVLSKSQTIHLCLGDYKIVRT